jgi:oligopeptidase B
MSSSHIFAQSNLPKAKKNPNKLEKHGHVRVDDYYWMNQRDKAEVLAYIGEENTYSNSYFERLLPLENKLLDEFEKRIDPNETSAPFIFNGETYQIRNKEGQDYSYIELMAEKKRFISTRTNGQKRCLFMNWVNGFLLQIILC